MLQKIRTFLTTVMGDCGCETPQQWLAGFHANARRNKSRPQDAFEELLADVNNGFAYRLRCGRLRCRPAPPFTASDLATAGMIPAPLASRMHTV